MAQQHPVIFWFRNDLRLADNPALTAAVDSGAPVIPVYLLDDETAGDWKRGGASRWWLHHSLAALDAALQKHGFQPLVFLKGAAVKTIPAFVEQVKAAGVYWNRRYEPWATTADTEIKAKLGGKDFVHVFKASLLFEPWEVKNKTGGQYKVFTPYSRACFEIGVQRPALPVPAKPAQNKTPVKSPCTLNDLGLLPDIEWYHGIADTWQPGEAGAAARLSAFIKDNGPATYLDNRDFPAIEGVSRLSPHLHFGEISPYQIWHAVSAMIAKNGKPEFAEKARGYLRQLVWREFSWHLLHHSPDFPEKPWNKTFEKFKWRDDAEALKRWQRGQTGIPIVDAGMRQLWQTGWMHNRVRMIVGSFLVKNLLLHWRHGEDWFWDTLVDADLGNNAAGWQWIAGCGADAAPYFRVFNPLLQSEKFDAAGDYIRTFVPELAKLDKKYIHAPWQAPPMILQSAGITLGKTYPLPMVDLAASRDRALEAYAKLKA